MRPSSGEITVSMQHWYLSLCPKHVEKINKYTKQNCAPSWIYFQDCTRMHGQQNTKFAQKLICKFHKSGYLKTYLKNGATLKWILREIF